MLPLLNRVCVLRDEIKKKETRISDLEAVLPDLKEETQAMLQVQKRLAQELKRRNSAFNECRRECDRLMHEATTEFESFNHSKLYQIELQVEVLHEAHRMSAVHMTKCDEHNIDLMLQIHHEKSRG